MKKKIRAWLQKEPAHKRPLWKNLTYFLFLLVFEGRIPDHHRYIFTFSFLEPLKSIRLLIQVLIGKITSHCMVLHLYGRGILEETLSVTRELNLKPFLVFGTLLGHYRDGGFIAHDSDIDLGLLEEDFKKKEQLIDAMEKKGYLVRLNTEYELGFEKKSIPGGWVDFFLFYKNKNNVSYVALEDATQKEHIYSFSPEIFNSFITVEFMNSVPVLIPAKTEQFLTESYGDWQTPVKNFDIWTGHKNEDT